MQGRLIRGRTNISLICFVKNQRFSEILADLSILGLPETLTLVNRAS